MTDGKAEEKCPYCDGGTWRPGRFRGADIPGADGVESGLLLKEPSGWILGFHEGRAGRCGGHIPAAFCPVCGTELERPEEPKLGAPCPHCSEGEPYFSDPDRGWDWRIGRDGDGWALFLRFPDSGTREGNPKVSRVPLAFCPSCGTRLSDLEGE